MKNLFGYLIIAVLMGFLFWNIFRNWEEIRSFPWRFEYINLLALLIFTALIYPVNILSWHLLTRAMDINLSFVSNAKIWMFSNLGRFLPGRVWQYPTRVYLLSREGVSKSQAIAVVVMEAFFILLTGSLSVILVVLFGELPLSGEVKIIFSSIAIVFLLLIVYSKGLFRKVLLLLSKVSKKELNLNIASVPLEFIPQIIFVFLLQFVVSGVILFILASSATDLDLTLLPVFIGVYALSWLLGYVTLITPSGLGVQEASIVALLSFMMPFPLASVIAIFFRIILFLSEASVLALLLLSKRRLA